jgi:acyl-CoA reductase-like NAD-dependent aldehyde dehydrogenase
LVLTPLIGAIAAGNCVIIKPSEMSEATSALLTHLINENFSPQHIRVIQGGVETSQALLAQKFDHIFFTGSTRVGKIVMEAAAKQLIPVTLELGGKSPCIVEPDIDIQETAKRIIWGKFLNAGQTCIAPDYLLVHQAIQEPLLAALTTCIREFYGQDPAQSHDYCRLINAQHLERLRQFLADGDILCGGEWDAQSRYLAPTLLINVDPTAPIMQSEIFGPILPIFDYDILDSAIAFINERPKPLALYLFSQNQHQQEKVLTRTSSGGICFNDTLLQFSAINLPFGGIGSSGMGSYHGKASFDTFSHDKSVLKNSFPLDINWRYAPYQGKLSLLKKIIGV